MRLETLDDFRQTQNAKRMVLVYDIEALDFVDEEDPRTSALAGRGYIISFDEEFVVLLHPKFGTQHFLREKYEFYEEPQPLN